MENRYSKEAIKTIKRLVKNKNWKKILIFYYSEANRLPPFPSFLKSLKDEEGKKKIINYLLFKEKDPFFEKTGLLKSHFFQKLKIDQFLSEYLVKREIVIKRIKEKEKNDSNKP